MMARWLPFPARLCFQRADGGGEDDHQQLGNDGRQRDHTEFLPPVGSVKTGRLVKFRIHALQTGHEDHDRIAQLDPHQNEHQHRKRAIRAAEPVMLLFADPHRAPSSGRKIQPMMMAATATGSNCGR